MMNKKVALSFLLGGGLTVVILQGWPALSERVHEKLSFFATAVKNHDQVGAVAPFSQETGKTIMQESLAHVSAARSLKRRQTLRVLEIGPGMGGVSEMIVSFLEQQHPRYKLDLVEIDRDFATLLKEKFKSNKRIKVYCKDFLDFRARGRYDLVISTLPLNSCTFSAQLVGDIFDKLRACLRADGVFTFVEYVGARHFSRAYYRLKLSDEEYELLQGKAELLAQIIKHNAVSKRVVPLNVPPTWVYTCTFGSTKKPLK